MAIQEAPDRARREAGAVLVAQQRRYLDQGDVHLALDRCQDDIAIGLNAMRSPVAALLPGARRASITPFPDPAHRARRSNTKSNRRRPA